MKAKPVGRLRSLGPTVLLTVALVACTSKEPIPRSQAVDVVLDAIDLQTAPQDLVAELEDDVPDRFGNVEEVWFIRSSAEQFGGWVDAETGEVLDVIQGEGNY